MTEDSDVSTETRSLCQIATTDFRTFHYANLGADRTVHNEILDVVAPLVKTAEAEIGILGDVYGRLRNAARGRLPQHKDEVIEPVRRHPELWEIKWKLTPRRLLRMYHVEPVGPPEVVALRFHLKATGSLTAEQIKDLQEEEMDLAHTRASDGAASRWGHKPKCSDCLLPETL